MMVPSIGGLFGGRTSYDSYLENFTAREIGRRQRDEQVRFEENFRRQLRGQENLLAEWFMEDLQKPLLRKPVGFLESLREEISAWHGDVLEAA